MYRCNRCHDLAIEKSEEWGYLKDALLSDISQRKLVDDLTFDAVPVIKARIVTIRHYTTEGQHHSVSPEASGSTLSPASYTDRPSASTVPYTHNLTTKDCTGSTVDTLIVEDTDNSCSNIELNDTVNNNEQSNMSTLFLNIDTNNTSISTLSSTLTGDSMGIVDC